MSTDNSTYVGPYLQVHRTITTSVAIRSILNLKAKKRLKDSLMIYFVKENQFTIQYLI